MRTFHNLRGRFSASAPNSDGGGHSLRRHRPDVLHRRALRGAQPPDDLDRIAARLRRRRLLQPRPTRRLVSGDVLEHSTHPSSARSAPAPPTTSAHWSRSRAIAAPPTGHRAFGSLRTRTPSASGAGSTRHPSVAVAAWFVAPELDSGTHLLRALARVLGPATPRRSRTSSASESATERAASAAGVRPRHAVDPADHGRSRQHAEDVAALLGRSQRDLGPNGLDPVVRGALHPRARNRAFDRLAGDRVAGPGVSARSKPASTSSARSGVPPIAHTTSPSRRTPTATRSTPRSVETRC